jgi:transcriptional regulator with XRE-family HTH domain
MSRLNRLRSIGGEANLARRIERERGNRGLSYDALAKRLTAAGCSISGSAIYKIEKADPPRRITVDELVALAQVFETTVEDLLIPVEVLDQERAKELLKDLDQAGSGFVDAIGYLLNTYNELFFLAADNPELHQYVSGHHFREDGTPQDPDEWPPLIIFTDDEIGKDLDIDETAFRTALAEFFIKLIDHAAVIANARVEAHAPERWAHLHDEH